MSDEQPILSERRGESNGILWLTLNRPNKLNALTLPLLREIREILFYARFDGGVSCIVITGPGRGSCTGMNSSGAANPNPDPKPDGLEEAGTTDIEGHRLNLQHETETYIAWRRMEAPIIANVNGSCVGAGFDLASHCDLAVVSTATRFHVAYVKRGLYADLGGFWSQPKVIGWRKAMALMRTDRFMSAEEAHEAGFSNYLVDPDELEKRTMQLALEIETEPPIGQKIGKLLAVRHRNAMDRIRNSAGRLV